MLDYNTYLNAYLTNKLLPNGTYLQNTTESGFISDLKGNLLASTPKFKLEKYKLEIKVDEANFKEIEIDEISMLLDLVEKGIINTPMGLSIGKMFYQLESKDQEKGIFILSKTDGGACIMKTIHSIVFGSYSTKIKMTDNQPQNSEVCNDRVISLGKLIIDNNS